jgi:AcrR family transcriptional regulator
MTIDFLAGQCHPFLGGDGRQRSEAGLDVTEARETVSRDAILELSAHLFAKRGYRATNLQLVAEQLGVTRQALYYHFRNKGDILAALFQTVMDKMESGVEAAPTDPDETRFVSMLRAHIRVIVDNTDLVALLLHERPEMAKLEHVDASARRQRYSERFVKAYKEGVDQAQLLALDPRLTVNTLLAAANSISAWYHTESKLDPDKVAANVEQLLTSGIQVKPGLVSATDGRVASTQPKRSRSRAASS